MFNSPIEEIKNRLDIVEVIGDYIKLQKAGANYRAPCPFHSEKNPSFFVSPSRQIWHCFGSCSEGGDIFKFIMKIEGVEFRDALRILAKKAGIELKKQDPKIRTERERLYEICEIACRFFETQLQESKIGQEAGKYLLERRINKESMKKWRLGYAPDVWQGLSDFLAAKGYKKQEIEKAGLAIKSANSEQRTANNYYDRFRGRIMFPIFDLSSQVVGFTGRIFNKKEEIAKYLNTPNTLLYDKSRILYGLDKAKLAIRKKDRCILTEGQTDVIMSHQAGIENAVATSGTALTAYQLFILKRYTENLITAFDMDMAGDSATKKGIDLAQMKGFNIRIIVMPKDLDPADVAAKNPEDWKNLTKKSKSILEFYFDTTFACFDFRTPEGKKEIARILLPIIKRIPNRIEQSHWLQQLAKKIEVKEEDVEIELKKLSSASSQVREKEIQEKIPETSHKTRRERLEQRILSLVLKSPKNVFLLDKEYLPFFSAQTREILKNFEKDPRFFEKQDAPEDLKDFLNELCFQAEIEEGTDLKKEIQTCCLEIKTMQIKNKLEGISQKIKKAEKENNKEEVGSLTQEFNALCFKLNHK